MGNAMKAMLCATALTLATQAAAQITFYDGDGFRGATFRVDRTLDNFAPTGFNDRAASAVVERGRWEVCTDAGFQGRCAVLSQGNYPSLAAIGLGSAISSVRPAGNVQYADEVPPPAPPPGYVAPVPPSGAGYDYRRRPDEHLFEVPVHNVRAVVGPPEQRCWVERQQVVEPPQGAPNPAGAIVGAIIGGVLGHQVGGGRGQDVATAGGAVAGAAIGANVGRSPGGVYSQDVQRCAAVPGSGRPDYWDVTYYFDGFEHHMQTGAPPPPTIWVNRQGEPRG
jgi:uncharacterized protein YcfJ